MAKIKIDGSAAVTARLPFEPIEKYNHLCVGELESVEVTKSVIDTDSKWEFAGKEVPRLAFHFKQRKENADEPDRFFTHSELPIAKVKVDGTGVTDENIAKMYTEMWRRLKHIHEQYGISPNYKELVLNPEFDPDTTADARIAEFVTFFETIAKAFNEGKNKKPVFVNADGNLIPMTMKLIASGTKKSYLAFPTWVAQGFIQPFKVKANKIETILKFKSDEGVVLGKAAVAGPGAPVPGGIGELNADLKAALGLG